MRLAQTLLDRNVRVCGTRMANRDISCDLEGEGKRLKKGTSVFRRNVDVMVQVWKDRTCANDEYDPDCNSCKQREEKQDNKHGNKETSCCWPVQYIHKRCRQGRPIPQSLLSSEENCKMFKKGGTISAKLCALEHIFFVQDTKYKQSKVQELPV